MPRKLGPGALLAPKGETLRTQTFCRRFLIRNSVTFDIALLENFSPNRPSGACESPFKLQGSVWMSQGVGCQGGVTWCHLGATSPALSRSASGCFPPDGIARFYPAQLFVQARRGTRTFSAQTKEWQCLLLKESQPGSKEGMTAVFSGCLTGSSMTGQ